MRSITLTLKKILGEGLRRHSDGQSAKTGLFQLQGLIPRPQGLSCSSTINNVVGSVSSWPFPQLFIGNKTNFKAEATTLSTLNDSWDASAVTTYNINDPSSTLAITGSGLWHFIDFFGTWIFNNGTCTVISKQEDRLYGNTVKALVENSVVIKSGCNHKLRAWFGGFTANSFWKSDIESYFIQQAEGNNGLVDWTSLSTMPDNFVTWSSVGGGDVLWFLYPRQSLYGSESEEIFDLVRPRIQDFIERNQLGFAPLPWQGSVHSMLPLGDHVIAYGDNGIAALTPVPGSPLVGVRKLSSIGVASRGAVGGDKNSGHIFVGASGRLFSLSPQLQLEALGYKEFFSGMLGTDIVVSYDPEESEYYISNNNNSYVLSKLGLAEIKDKVSSLAFYDGGLVGTTQINSGLTKALVSSPVIDFDLSGRKSIRAVRALTTDITDLEVLIGYRNSNTGAFTTTAWKSLNTEGVAFFNVTAQEFYFSLRGTKGSLPTVDHIQVEYQLSDTRFFRSQRSNASENVV